MIVMSQWCLKMRKQFLNVRFLFSGNPDHDWIDAQLTSELFGV